MTTRVSLPGMRSPGAGFDQPFEMLDACHDRVRRSLDLLRRLRDYLRGHGHGCDDSARQAARDVLRYFDIAAPLHHEDEEMHVFPPLLDNGTPEVRAAAIWLARSSGIAIDLNPLILAPPVFPSGTSPTQVPATAPITRKNWPVTSRGWLWRMPQNSMRRCARTCCTVGR